MLRIVANNSASGATKYYSEGLSKADYYSEKGEIIGNWGGKLAERLGLTGQVTKDEFEALCYNLDPSTGEQLTARNIDGRRVGYDFTFSAPKSISIIYSQNEDKEILSSFRSAVLETMQHIETGCQTRVRTDGQQDNRTTGNIIWAEFIHDTSRPVNGVPDCHLHAHNFVFNATWDEKEGKHKAVELGQVKGDGAYYEAYFNARFAKNLQACGYQIDRNERDFEVAGIDRETIDKFSNRTKEINGAAEKKNITDTKALDELGAKTRENKRTGLGRDELKEIWKNRLDQDEYDSVIGAKTQQSQVAKEKLSEKEVLDYALAHELERKSAVTEKELLTTALKRGIGICAPDAIIKEYGEREDLLKRAQKGNTFVTTKEALAEEKKLVESCREAKGCAKPINQGYLPKAKFLNQEQKAAIRHTLSATDKISIIEGGAGTGKTTLMQEVKNGIEEQGKKLFAFAPSSEASRGVLQSEGFANAETVAKLIQDKNLQKELGGQVIWIDEAGMLGNKQMNQVIGIAKEQKARLILTGDTRQHSSVERGDALRIMQTYGGIKAAQVREIQRQKPADYKKAVSLISKGNVEKGFNKLEGFGAIKEITSSEDRCQAVASEYVQKSLERKGKDFKSVLVVAPTHRENSLITNEIRKQLKGTGKLKGSEQFFTRLNNLNLTEAEKQNPSTYKEGQIVLFHKNTKGYKIGTPYQVVGKDEEGRVLVKDEKKVKPFDMPEGGNYGLFEKREIGLMQGDKIRITQNGKSMEGRRLNNGQVYEVKGFTKDGDIVASNGAKISKDFGSIAHGYAMTSHSSQGKTVDQVIIAQSSMSFRASSREQFYVSVSRGKEGVSIYTDDKQDLLASVSRSQQRMTATEISGGKVIQLDEHRARFDRLRQIAKSASEKVRGTLSKVPEAFVKLSEVARARAFINSKGMTR